MTEMNTSSGESGGTPALTYADPATPRPHAGAHTSRWDVAGIVLRVAGAYLILVEGLPALVRAVDYAIQGGSRFNSMMVLVYSALFILFSAAGSVLVFCSDRLAGFLLPRSEASAKAVQTPASARSVQEIAFSVLGLYLVVVDAIPGLALYLWRWVAEPSTPVVTRTNVAPFIFEHLVQLVAGAWLFFGSHQLAAYWQRRRWDAGESSVEERAL